MNEWWSTLGDASRVFWGIAIGATLFQVLMFAASLISGHDFDHSVGNDDGGTTEGLKILSVRAIVAFLVGFGWAGALFLQDGKTLVTATVIAVIAGVIFTGVILAMMRMLMSLRADGTMNYENAIGQVGHVYVTVPPKHSGQGQVEIMIQGRLATALAVTDYHHPLPPQTPVTVQSVEGRTLLVVYPA